MIVIVRGEGQAHLRSGLGAGRIPLTNSRIVCSVCQFSVELMVMNEALVNFETFVAAKNWCLIILVAEVNCFENRKESSAKMF